MRIDVKWLVVIVLCFVNLPLGLMALLFVFMFDS